MANIDRSELDDVDRAFINDLVPGTAVPTSVLAIVRFFDPNDGKFHFRWYMPVTEDDTSTVIGTMEMVKMDMFMDNYKKNGGDV